MYFYSPPSELSEELPPDYPTIRHFFDVWHFIKVNTKFSITFDYILPIFSQFWKTYSKPAN